MSLTVNPEQAPPCGRGVEWVDYKLKAMSGALQPAVDVSSPPVPPKPKLLDQVRHAIRTRHYSYMTEKAYVGWIKRFIFFHNKRHPAEMGEAEIARFLSSLARDSRVSASTQNQALNALLFLYRKVLGKEIGYVDGVVRARRPQRLPVVLTREEVKGLLGQLDKANRLMTTLLYGAGLRLMECLRLRVKDINFANNQIVVRGGKGDKDRYTMLPSSLREALANHLEVVKRQHQRDLERGLGRVVLPNALDRKYPNAGREWSWHWVFPAPRHYTDRIIGEQFKHHIHESVLQRAVREATLKAGIAKPASCHSLRHYAELGIIVTALQRTFWKLGWTCVPLRRCWAITHFRVPSAISRYGNRSLALRRILWTF